MKLVRVCRIQPAEYKRFHFAIAREWIYCRFCVVRDSIPDFRLINFSNTGDQVSDGSSVEFGSRLHLRRKDTHLLNFVGASGLHELNLLSRLDATVEDSRIHDDTAIVVVDRIEDECLQ